MNKSVLFLTALVAVVLTSSGCEKVSNSAKSLQSDWIGIDRKIEIYSCHTGKLIKVVKGSVRLNEEDTFAGGGSFLVNGKKMHTNMCFISLEIGIKEEAL